MPKKTKIIFIATFILVLLILIFFVFFKKSPTDKNIDPNTGKPFTSIGTNTNTTGSTNSNNNINTNTTNNINWENATSNQVSKFFQITDFAIAGAGFTEEMKPTPNTNSTQTTPKLESVPIIRYVKRQTGHIYEMNLNTKEVNKVSNSTIPSVHKVLFDSSAKNFIYRYLSTENNSIASFITSLGGNNGEFLPFNIKDVSLSLDKDSFFYLIKNTGGVNGFIRSFTDNKITQVFKSSFSDWLPQWISSGKVYLTTKPSWRIDGSLFSLNTKNGSLTKIFGGVKGLTTLSNSDGSVVLYSDSLSIGPKLFLLNTEDRSVVDLDSYGLAEKCIWGKNNIYIYCGIPNTIVGTNYPDDWYKGLYSFSDYFIKINTKTKEVYTLANSTEETPVDATHLILNKDNTILFFTNKKDSTLWSLNIK